MGDGKNIFETKFFMNTSKSKTCYNPKNNQSFDASSLYDQLYKFLLQPTSGCCFYIMIVIGLMFSSLFPTLFPIQTKRRAPLVTTISSTCHTNESSSTIVQKEPVSTTNETVVRPSPPRFASLSMSLPINGVSPERFGLNPASSAENLTQPLNELQIVRLLH